MDIHSIQHAVYTQCTHTHIHICQPSYVHLRTHTLLGLHIALGFSCQLASNRIHTHTHPHKKQTNTHTHVDFVIPRYVSLLMRKTLGCVRRRNTDTEKDNRQTGSLSLSLSHSHTRRKRQFDTSSLTNNHTYTSPVEIQ